MLLLLRGEQLLQHLRLQEVMPTSRGALRPQLTTCFAWYTYNLHCDTHCQDAGAKTLAPFLLLVDIVCAPVLHCDRIWLPLCFGRGEKSAVWAGLLRHLLVRRSRSTVGATHAMALISSPVAACSTNCMGVLVVLLWA
eukprot:COSAG01_NODE_9544_length_2414_cov_1.990497_1_plen_138_part_00